MIKRLLYICSITSLQHKNWVTLVICYYSRPLLLAIRQKSRKPSFWEVMDSFVLLANASLAASRSFLKLFLACLNFTLDSYFRTFTLEDLFCCYKRKNVFYETWQQQKLLKWERLDLILSMKDTYINCNLNPLTKFTSSSRSTEFRDIFPWNIFKMITKAIPISKKIVISYAMKGDIPLWVWWKLRQLLDQNFPMEGKQESKKSKRAGLWETQSGIQVGKLTIQVRSFKII